MQGASTNNRRATYPASVLRGLGDIARLHYDGTGSLSPETNHTPNEGADEDKAPAVPPPEHTPSLAGSIPNKDYAAVSSDPETPQIRVPKRKRSLPSPDEVDDTSCPQLRRDYKHLRTEYDGLRFDNASLQTNKATLHANSATLKAELATGNTQYAALNTALTILRGQATTLQARYEDLRAEHAACDADTNNYRALLNVAHGEQTRAERDRESVRADVLRFSRRAKRAERKLKSTEKKLDEQVRRDAVVCVAVGIFAIIFSGRVGIAIGRELM